MSGGILLGAGLVHLLVQAEEDAVLSSYPLGHVLAVCGFLGAFLLEKVAFGHAHSHGHAEEHGAHPDGGVELRMLHHVPHKHAKHMHHHHHHPEHEGEETPACVEEHDSAEHDMVVDLCEEDHGIPLLEGVVDDDDAIDADEGDGDGQPIMHQQQQQRRGSPEEQSMEGPALRMLQPPASPASPRGLPPQSLYRLACGAVWHAGIGELCRWVCCRLPGEPKRRLDHHPGHRHPCLGGIVQPGGQLFKGRSNQDDLAKGRNSNRRREHEGMSSEEDGGRSQSDMENTT